MDSLTMKTHFFPLHRQLHIPPPRLRFTIFIGCVDDQIMVNRTMKPYFKAGGPQGHRKIVSETHVCCGWSPDDAINNPHPGKNNNITDVFERAALFSRELAPVILRFNGSEEWGHYEPTVITDAEWAAHCRIYFNDIESIRARRDLDDGKMRIGSISIT
jgi:hypothetical protein